MRQSVFSYHILILIYIPLQYTGWPKSHGSNETIKLLSIIKFIKKISAVSLIKQNIIHIFSSNEVIDCVERFYVGNYLLISFDP